MRNRCRAVARSTIALVLLIWIAAAAHAQEAVRFDIPAQALADSLRAVASQTNISVLFDPPLVAGRTAPALKAVLTADAALSRLLAGTGLKHQFLNDRTVTLESVADLRASETPADASHPVPAGNHARKLAQAEPNASVRGASLSTALADIPNNSLVIEQLVVTATRRSLPLLDVPLSVSAITRQEIRERGYTNYADYLDAIPGVYFVDDGPGTSQIQIRGLAATEGGAASTVATYFGETLTSVLSSFNGKPNLRLVDIDRVEVLRGPQGTLFGANSLAGVVRIIPTPPKFDQFELDVGSRVFVTAHSSDASYHLEGVANLPLANARLALRLVGYKDDIAGYIDNAFPGQAPLDYSAQFALPAGTLVTPAVPAFARTDINSGDTWGARAALSWQASEQLRLDLTYLSQDDTLDSDPFTVPAAGEYLEPRATDAFDPIEKSERLHIASLVLNYDWDAVSLIAASNWAEKTRFFKQDISFIGTQALGVPIPWVTHDRSRGRLFTQEIRAQSRGEGPWQWTAGGFYFEQSATANQFVADFSCPTCLPTVFFGQDFALNFGPAKFVDQTQRSVFGDISYEIAPRWTLGLGLRYLEEALTNLSPAVDGVLANGPQPAQPSVTAHVYETNPSAYVRFEPSEDVTAYLQAARGFRSGAANQPIPSNCQAEAAALGIKRLVDPDTLWNYELGLKSLLAGGRLAIAVDVYRQQWRGVQLGTLLACGFSQNFNGGSVNGEGAEFELQARLAQSWRFNLAAAYNRNKFKEVARNSSGLVSGERVPNAPQKNGSAGLQYDFALGGQWSGFARADYVYVGDVRLHLAPTISAREPAFQSGNLRLGVRRDELTLDVFANNITDQRAVVGVSILSGVVREVLLRPREAGVELRYSFR